MVLVQKFSCFAHLSLLIKTGGITAGFITDNILIISL